jgi:Tfp pilus assembly protein PilN
MLRTNLSTRPFYNERLVHLVLGMLALAVLAITVFNLWEVFELSGRHAQLQARISEADDRARTARDEASRIRAGINPRELETASVAAREANAIIERRAFSWTDLFNRFESTLPDTVRITSVVPRIDKDGVITVTVVVLARTVEGIETFIENLEEDGAFSGFLSTEEFPDETGVLQATLVGRYAPPATQAQKGARP